MKKVVLARSVVLLALLGLTLAHPLAAQHYTQGRRTFVPSAQALGMGGAAVAVPSPQTALFYNPAHLTHIRAQRTPITVLGLSASISKNVSNQIDFFNERLKPAIDQGVEELDPEEEAALYEEVFEVGGTPTMLSGDLLLPSFAMNRGAYGFGGGFFIHSDLNYFVEDAGAGVPGIDFAFLADFMAVGSGAFDLDAAGVKGLTVGVTGKYAQRYVSLKNKPLDAFDEDESVYVLGASSLAMDLGLLYEPAFLKVPGRLYLGLVAADLSFSEFDYQFAAYYAKNEEVRNDEKIADEIALARSRFQLHTTYRAGIAYVLPQLAGPLGETSVALDYVTSPAEGQPVPAKLSLGFQTVLGSTVALRAGLNQGYTSAGVGLMLPFARIDYTYYGTEEGRVPGQSPSWHHQISFVLGSF